MADILEQMMSEAPPPLSDERDVRQTSDQQDEFGVPALDKKIEAALATMYGNAFPLLSKNPRDSDWVDWAKTIWDRHRSGVQHRLHLVERNRLFRRGIHWISSIGGLGWREPPKPKDAARVVFNMIAPALDQRAQIISEQRPGFKTRPATADPDDIKKAEAKQFALEYQWDQQDMEAITKEAVFWAGTDGACFLELYWDPDSGPWHEAYDYNAESGQPVPLGPDGQPASNGVPHKFPVGDVRTIVRRIEQVRASAQASATRKPWYWVVRDVMSAADAVKQYGLDVADAAKQTMGVDSESAIIYGPYTKQGFILPDENETMRDQDTVVRFTVYCDRSEFLPQGLHLVVVGDKIVFKGQLLFGVAPMVRWTDGSSDPAFYPTAIMDGWIEPQMRVNAVLSKWVENVRLNAGPKLLAKRQSIAGETLLGSTMTVIEAKGIGSLSDIIKPLDAFSLSPDATNLLQFEIRNFENLSGWNDVSRGSFAADASGRAILAVREQLERIFAPPVSASAKAMSEWAKISCAAMKWGYDIPRTVGSIGKGRPDLTRALSSDDFDGAVDVWIDAETLMPLPRALRLTLLDNLFAKGLMPARDYLRRLPFAWVRDMEYPDEVHAARAKRCAEAIRMGQMLPILWQDDENIHMDVLSRELILQDDTPQEIRAMAYDRWMQLYQQMQMKMMMGAPPSSPPAMPQGMVTPGGGGPSPQDQPFAGTNPGVKAGTFSSFGGNSDEQRNATIFDRLNKEQGRA